MFSNDEIPAKYQHDRTGICIHVIRTRHQCDDKLGAIFPKVFHNTSIGLDIGVALLKQTLI